MRNNFTTFYIVRHGETDWNVQRRVQGHTDIPLNENGEMQAKFFANKLKHIKFDLAFSSDLLRAHRTAKIIALEHKLEVQTTEILREKKLGKFEGQHYDTVSTYFKLIDSMDQQQRLKHKIVDDAESDEEVINRLFTFLKETSILYPGKNILVVTHGAMLRNALAHLNYTIYDELKTCKISNTAHIELLADGEEAFIKSIDGITFAKDTLKHIE
jgi:broad specificity phosphatase PhoE